MIINVDFMYPVGSLYITTDTTFNPNIKFGGTWARLEGDVYLKNVPSTAADQIIGDYGGTSSEHKIPISSMPSHSHGAWNHGFWNDKTTASDQWGNYPITLHADKKANWTDYSTKSAGGGQAYYPYYYGIICWHRTA